MIFFFQIIGFVTIVSFGVGFIYVMSTDTLLKMSKIGNFATSLLNLRLYSLYPYFLESLSTGC